MVNYATFLMLSVIHIDHSVGEFRSTWASRRSALKVILNSVIKFDVKLTSNCLTDNVSDALLVLMKILFILFRLSHFSFMVNHWIKVLHQFHLILIFEIVTIEVHLHFLLIFVKIIEHLLRVLPLLDALVRFFCIWLIILRCTRFILVLSSSLQKFLTSGWSILS